LVKADVGLGNVDNTTDLLKPISTATQTALDGKTAPATTIPAANGTAAVGVSATAARSDHVHPLQPIAPATWTLAGAYTANTLVRYADSLIYMANAAIPANTAWAVGATGATWRLVSGVSAAVLDVGTYRQTAKQTIPNNSPTRVTGFTAVNASSQWDNANSRFVITIAGLYRVRGRISYDGAADGIRQAFLQKNGVTVTTAASAPVAVNTITIHVEQPMALVVGDTITLHTFQTSGASLQTSVTTSGHFSELEIIQIK